MRRQQSELAAQQALLKSIDAADVSDADMELVVQNDPVARQLFVELGWRKLDQVYMEGAVVSGARTHYSDRSLQDIKTMQDQYDARRAELADMARQKNRSKAQMEVQRVEASLAVLVEQEQHSAESRGRAAKKSGKFRQLDRRHRNDAIGHQELGRGVVGDRRENGRSSGSRFTPRRESPLPLAERNRPNCPRTK